MGRFVCEACRNYYRMTTAELVVWACCELCGLVRGDWGPKRVSWGGGPPLDPAVAHRRLRLLKRLAELSTASPDRS